MEKVRIFVDYWNFQLSMGEIKGNQYRADWKKVSPWLFSKLQEMLAVDLKYEGTLVYLSFDPHKVNHQQQKDWAINFLDRIPGVDVNLQERRVKDPPKCPICHHVVETCPHCSGSMKGSVEKGVDTSIVTDLIGLAWEGAWNDAILVSSDRDFIPAVELLHRKGYRVINAHFPPAGMELARKCWGAIDLRPALDEIEHIREKKS
jgi:uncharacterized LabA/DUF88 family protein